MHRLTRGSDRLLDALLGTVSLPSLWIPSLVLLLPTLVLQVAAPTYLRTRLSPSPFFVIAGALLLVLLTQIALPTTIALVHRRRTGARIPGALSLFRLSFGVGVRTFLGLIAGVVPGLWLQARYAFAPILEGRGNDALRASTVAAKPVSSTLILLSLAALLASLLGQSLVAVLNESLGVVHAIGNADGRTIFALDYPAHVLTTFVAYFTAAFALTLQAVGVSVVYETAAQPVGVSASEPTRSVVTGRRTLAVRLAQSAAVLTVLAGLVAAVYKVQQHFG
jgi:hypothetical protein